MGVVGGATVVGGARARKVALDLADSRFPLLRMKMKTNDHDESEINLTVTVLNLFCALSLPAHCNIWLTRPSARYCKM